MSWITQVVQFWIKHKDARLTNADMIVAAVKFVNSKMFLGPQENDSI